MSRNPEVENLLHWLEPNPHLPADVIWVPQSVEILAKGMAEQLPDSPELIAGLRKLLEAKDCFVRATRDALTSGEREFDPEGEDDQQDLSRHPSS